MGNTFMRVCEGEEVNDHTFALIALLKMAFAEASPPLISIAIAFKSVCDECPALADMMGQLLAGKSPQEVADATSIELPDGVTAGEMGQA